MQRHRGVRHHRVRYCIRHVQARQIHHHHHQATLPVSAVLQRERSTLSASELRTLSQIGQTEEQLQDMSRVRCGASRRHAHTTYSQTVLGVILGGGAGTRLYPLTKTRAKPAVPLGANYRLIDIPVSNCINSNINKIYCLTQFNSASLNRHLSSAYVRCFRHCCGV